MIRIGICDDEIAVHNEVKKIVRGHDFKTQTEIVSFMSGKELLGYDNVIDILLLDISMPGIDGIEAGHLLRKEQMAARIIMLTSMVERFQEAFEIEAYRFVTKPIEEKKLIRAIEDTIKTFIGCDIIEVYSGNVKYLFQQRELSYISREGSRTEVIVGDTVFQSVQTLGDWEKVLDSRMFFKVHKSYIVNLSKIESIGEQIQLQSKEVLPVARRRRSELMKYYMQYDLRYR